MTTKMAVLGDSLSRMVIRNQLEEGSGQTLFSTILKTRVEKYQLGYIRPNGRIHQLFLGPRSRSELRQIDRHYRRREPQCWQVRIASEFLSPHCGQFYSPASFSGDIFGNSCSLTTYVCAALSPRRCFFSPKMNTQSIKPSIASRRFRRKD